MTLDELTRLVHERLEGRFYGKYAGVVTDNDDPLGIGRVRARVPSVLGETQEAGWAMPCAPFGGGFDRGFLILPEVGDAVWIEFAAGDVSRPIWAGTWWGSPQSCSGQDSLAAQSGAETPTYDGAPAGPGRGVIRTRAGHTICFDDDGEVVIVANGNGAEIRIDAEGAVIVTAEKIKLGADAAEPIVLGGMFRQLYDAHTHPTGVGPSGPPLLPMQPSHVSAKSFTE